MESSTWVPAWGDIRASLTIWLVEHVVAVHVVCSNTFYLSLVAWSCQMRIKTVCQNGKWTWMIFFTFVTFTHWHTIWYTNARWVPAWWDRWSFDKYTAAPQPQPVLPHLNPGDLPSSSWTALITHQNPGFSHNPTDGSFAPWTPNVWDCCSSRTEQ